MSVSIDSLVSDVIAQYDRNRNGVIEVNSPDETVRSETRWQPDPDPYSHDPYYPNPFHHGDRWVTESYTMRDLLVAADADKDGVASRSEIETVVRSFDKDGNGKLESRGFWGWLTGKPKQDYDHFDDQYGERLISRWSDRLY